MATVNLASLYYDTKAEEGMVRYREDLGEFNTVMLLDTINDWIYHLEKEQQRLHAILYPKETN